MSKNNGVNLLPVVCASILGTLVGVLVGMLIAPKSGDELRTGIVTSGRDFVKKAKTKKDDFFDELEDDIEEIGDFESDILD